MSGSMWGDGIIPVAVEGGRFELDGGQLSVCDLDSGRVGGGIESSLDFQSGTCGGVANEVDDHLQADQWSATPVLGNVAEQAVLDRIPLAGPRRKVTHVDAQSGL